MADYQRDLTNLIEKSLKDVEFSAQMLRSLTQGIAQAKKLQTLDLNGIISSYKCLVTTTTLINAYNQSFYDPKMQELEKNMNSILESSEKELLELLKVMIDYEFWQE